MKRIISLFAVCLLITASIFPHSFAATGDLTDIRPLLRDDLGSYIYDRFTHIFSSPLNTSFNVITHLISGGNSEIPPLISGQRYRLLISASVTPSNIGKVSVSVLGRTISSDTHPQYFILTSGSYSFSYDFVSDSSGSGWLSSVAVHFSQTSKNISISYSSFSIEKLDTLYTITPSAGSGGSISPSSVKSVGQGSSQTFNIIPDSGYTIKTVNVNGVSMGAIGSYTFINVQSDSSISAEFERVSVSPVAPVSSPYVPWNVSLFVQGILSLRSSIGIAFNIGGLIFILLSGVYLMIKIVGSMGN